MSKYLDYDGLSHFKDKCDEEYANTLATGYVKTAFTPDLNVGYGFSGFTKWAFNITIISGLTLAITWIDTSTSTTYSCIGITSDDGLEYYITVTSMTEVSTGSGSGDYVTLDTEQYISGTKTFTGYTEFNGTTSILGDSYGNSKIADVNIGNCTLGGTIPITAYTTFSGASGYGDTIAFTDGTNTKTLTELLTDSGGTSSVTATTTTDSDGNVILVLG